MGIVVAMHVSLVFVIARSMVVVDTPPPPPLIGEIIEQPTQALDPPPQVQPQLTNPPLALDPPIDPVPPTPDAPETIVPRVLPPDQLTDHARVTTLQPQLMGVRRDARHPLTQPAYPASEIRAGNEGSAEVEIYVLPSGRVGDARIARSTGFERLDRAALEEAKQRWKLLPATRDGVPVAQWYRVRVVFELRNQ